MQGYNIIFATIALHIAIISFAGHKRARLEGQKSSGSNKRTKKRLTQHDLDSQLFSAADRGDVRVINVFIRAGANVKTRDHSERTPLHLAARGGHKQAIDALCMAGADKNAQDSYGQTPLHYAAAHPVIMYDLLRKGADPIPLERIVPSPLEFYRPGHYRGQMKAQLVTDKLIKEYYIHTFAKDGSMIPVTSDDGDTILHRLFSRKPLPLDFKVEQLILRILLCDTHRVLDVGHKNMNGYNILHLGAMHHPQRLASLLVFLFKHKTKEEQDILLTTTTPHGDTLYSLEPSLQKTLKKGVVPSDTWTPLMHVAYNVTTPTEKFREILAKDDNPAYVADTHDSAISVARCEGLKDIIREEIRRKRRKEIFDLLDLEYNQPKDLINLIFRFDGTYEPPQT